MDSEDGSDIGIVIPLKEQPRMDIHLWSIVTHQRSLEPHYVTAQSSLAHIRARRTQPALAHSRHSHRTRTHVCKYHNHHSCTCVHHACKTAITRAHSCPRTTNTSRAHTHAHEARPSFGVHIAVIPIPNTVKRPLHHGSSV